MMQLSHPARGPEASHGRAGYARSLAVAAAVIAGLAWAPRPAAAEDRPAAFARSAGKRWRISTARPAACRKGREGC